MVKNPSANAGDLVLIPELRRSSGEGNGNPLQYSCLGNPMDRGAWWASVHKSQRVGHHLATEHEQDEKWCWGIPNVRKIEKHSFLL